MAAKFLSYEGFEYKLSYDLLNSQNKKALLFLHGWGSNKEVMKKAFGSVFKNYAHIYLDMPGFGKSNHHKPLTTQDYANITQKFLQQFDFEIEAIFGHSFGGKVATLLNPKKLVLLSSAGIIEKKPLIVKCKITLYKLFKPFGAKRLKKLFISSDAKGMDEAMYQTFKNVVDEDFTQHFQSFKGDATIFWGKRDTATTLKSGEKIAALIPQSRFYPLEGNHYFFLHHSNTIEKFYQNETFD